MNIKKHIGGGGRRWVRGKKYRIIKEIRCNKMRKTLIERVGQGEKCMVYSSRNGRQGNW